MVDIAEAKRRAQLSLSKIKAEDYSVEYTLAVLDGLAELTDGELSDRIRTARQMLDVAVTLPEAKPVEEALSDKAWFAEIRQRIREIRGLLQEIVDK